MDEYGQADGPIRYKQAVDWDFLKASTGLELDLEPGPHCHKWPRLPKPFCL